jgi:4-diphosphocytidyl-2-C-methyl-D-erythritol kinase
MKAPAKINLLLRILSVRPNGCHDIESIMQAVDLCDEVDVEMRRRSDISGEIICKTEGADLPEDNGNIAYRAARVFLDKYECDLANYTVNIRIRKRIPLTAGLAGGSADAAAVLLALAGAHAPGTSLAELADLGVSLGADVPFQLYACAKANPSLGYAKEAFGTAVAEGIGERLCPVHPAKSAYVLLVNPGTFVSAAEAYRLFDLKDEVLQNETQGGTVVCISASALSGALTSGEETAILTGLSNDLMPMVAKEHPEVRDLMMQMEDICSRNGGKAMMSGSGPTVYGLFFREHEACEAYKEVRKSFSSMFVTLSQTI